jgi:hypothetical protein
VQPEPWLQALVTNNNNNNYYYCRNVVLFQVLKFNIIRGNRFLRNQTTVRLIPNTKSPHQHWFINSQSKYMKERPNRKSEKETCKESDKKTRKRIAWMYLCEEKLLA